MGEGTRERESHRGGRVGRDKEIEGENKMEKKMKTPLQTPRFANNRGHACLLQ